MVLQQGRSRVQWTMVQSTYGSTVHAPTVKYAAGLRFKLRVQQRCVHVSTNIKTLKIFKSTTVNTICGLVMKL